MKMRIDLPEEESAKGKRGRRRRDDEAQPKADEKPVSKWKERDGFFQGAKVRRR